MRMAPGPREGCRTGNGDGSAPASYGPVAANLVDATK